MPRQRPALSLSASYSPESRVSRTRHGLLKTEEDPTESALTSPNGDLEESTEPRREIDEERAASGGRGVPRRCPLTTRRQTPMACRCSIKWFPNKIEVPISGYGGTRRICAVSLGYRQQWRRDPRRESIIGNLELRVETFKY